MNKPSHMTQHEWDEEVRRAQAQMQFDIYNAPEYVNKISRIGGALIMTAFVLLIVAALVSLAVDIIRGEA